jgi:hypothetical protein
MLFKKETCVCVASIALSELSQSNSSWEDWIFAKSQTRHVLHSVFTNAEFLLIEPLQVLKSLVPY